MNKTNTYYISIILFSGIFLSILLNLKSLWSLYGILDTKIISDFSDEESKELIYFIQQLFSQFFVFSALVFFNFYWKDYLFKRTMFYRLLNVLYVIIGNLVIIFLTAYLQAILFKTESLGLDVMGISFYLWIDFFVYSIAIPLAYILKINKNLNQAKSENLVLKTEKANAELTSLKEQLSPHFFFNTLNALSAVIRSGEKNDSIEFVGKLSQVYRYILDSRKNNLVSIKEEIEFLNDYAYLLHKRFGNNFIIENKISNHVLNDRIPPLALQLLLENVTKHNILLSSNILKISIENNDDFIYFINEMKERNNVDSTGLGLTNLNKRYQMIYDKEIEITKKNHHFCVKIPIVK